MNRISLATLALILLALAQWQGWLSQDVALLLACVVVLAAQVRWRKKSREE
jgi:hypothetical protein